MKYDLVGVEGNAFAVMGYVKRIKCQEKLSKFGKILDYFV